MRYRLESMTFGVFSRWIECEFKHEDLAGERRRVLTFDADTRTFSTPLASDKELVRNISDEDMARVIAGAMRFK